MNTAGGNDEQTDPFIPKEPPARDPSIRDVLARLDQIEAKIGALGEQVGAINARIDELMKPVLYVGQTPPNTEVETK